MQLSTTTRYALRAVVHLARADDGRIPAVRLSRELDLPENYLSKTLHELARQGILDSTRGPGGGYRLAVPADELPLLRVVETFESVEPDRSCVLGRSDCDPSDPCPVHDRWKEIAGRVADFFATTTVADVVGDRPTSASEQVPTDGEAAAADD